MLKPDVTRMPSYLRHDHPRMSSLTGWHSYANFTHIPTWCATANRNVLHQGFRKLLSDRHTDRQTSYLMRGHFRSCDKDGSHTIGLKNPCYTQTWALSFTEPVMGDWTLHCGNSHLDVFGSRDLDLDTINFIYKLDSYCLELYWMCKYELSTSSLSKVIVWQTDIQIYRIDRNK